MQHHLPITQFQQLSKVCHSSSATHTHTHKHTHSLAHFHFFVYLFWFRSLGRVGEVLFFIVNLRHYVISPYMPQYLPPTDKNLFLT